MLGKRGKKAAADLEIVPLFEDGSKPPPPEDMPALQADVWRSVVDAMPPRWFDRGTFPVLKGLCRHAVAADHAWAGYARALEAGADIEEVTAWSVLHRREQAAVERASADLRLTKIARLAKTSETERQRRQLTITARPWEG
jgi:hypothetical protein